MARRAKRVVWAFRLIFYPGAAIIAILLLAGRAETKDYATLAGHTAQGRDFTLWVDADRPAQFATWIQATCPDTGWKYTFSWRGEKWTRMSFDDDTGAISAGRIWVGTWSDGVPADAELRLKGRLDGTTVRGTVRLIDHRRGFDCDSGDVSFSASTAAG